VCRCLRSFRPREAPASSILANAASEKIAFEVASIKPNKSSDPRQGVRLLPGGRLDVTNMGLRAMIGTAWGSEAIQTPGQIVGGPNWIDADRFDIVAKAAVDPGLRGTDVRDRLITMLRSLLEDRFLVKVHTESRVVPIYALVLANKEARFGTLFKPSKADCYNRDNRPPQNAAPDPARLCGIRGGNGNVTYLSVTIQEIARSLANYPVVSRPVLDRTGLTGTYDLHMEFVPAFIDSPNRDGSQIANPAADSGPNLFTALVEQAGLKLQGKKGPVDFLVIDRAERPTED
jgi:uncharacterized protein (TIGR03435 family)